MFAVMEDIMDITCGHPGFSVWLLDKSVELARHAKVINYNTWLKVKRDQFTKELYKTNTFSRMLEKLQCSRRVIKLLNTMARNINVPCNDNRVISFLRASGIIKPIDSEFTFTSPVIRDCCFNCIIQIISIILI